MTVAVIAAIIASTATASAPSVSSTRRSILPAVICRGGRALRRVTGLVDGYPLGADDRADRGVVRLGDPVDELGGFALRNALGDHPEVADASVLTGLGVAQRAGDPLVVDRVNARADGGRERHEADGVLVVAAAHGVDLQALGVLSCGTRRDLRVFAQEDVLEGVLGTGGAVAVDSVTDAIRPNCRSSGVATEEAIVAGLAPGRPAFTEMVGNSTSGSGDTGSNRYPK